MRKKKKRLSSKHLNLNDADAQCTQGASYRRTGKVSEAMTCFLSALEADPEHIPSLRQLAQTLRSVGRPFDALKYMVRAVILQPKNTELLCDLADTWQTAGHFPQAIAAYQKALELTPGLPTALYSLGCAQIEANEFVPAIASLEQALTTQPNWLEARHNLARALYEMGQVESAFIQFQRCAEATQRKESERSRAMSAVIVPGVPGVDNFGILGVRRRWADQDLPAPSDAFREKHARQPSQRLRIGYVSSFFHGPNWMKPVWGLINQHDREEFEVHLFSDSQSTTLSSIQYGYRLQAGDRFHDIVGVSNESVAQLIEESAIDILVDLNGYSKVQRLALFPLRPAPVIVGWFNLYGPSGIRTFDYLIGDHHVIPTDEEQFYTEKIARVSGSWLTFEPVSRAPDVVDPPCLAGTGITFGSAASQYKITSDVVRTWSRILDESPLSSLVLKNKHLGTPSSRDFVHGLFEKNGITRDRVHLEGSDEYFQFLRFYDRIDLALETFPYGGATTTTDAIWQGVPVVTCEGDRWASRLSISILREAGLEEFVTKNIDGYVALATHLARSPETPSRLAELRRNMRSRLRLSSVCNTHAFTREVEHIYRRCWSERCAQTLGS